WRRNRSSGCAARRVGQPFFPLVVSFLVLGVELLFLPPFLPPLCAAVDGVDEAGASVVAGVPDCAGVAADFDAALFEDALFDELLFDETLFDDDLCVAVFAALCVVSCAVVCAWSEAPANSTSAAATREIRFMRQIGRAS